MQTALSDEYVYTLHDYYSKPRLLNNGGFILIASPEASFNSEIVSLARSEMVGIGKIGKFLGALNFRDVWLYQEPPDNLRKRA